MESVNLEDHAAHPLHEGKEQSLFVHLIQGISSLKLLLGDTQQEICSVGDGACHVEGHFADVLQLVFVELGVEAHLDVVAMVVAKDVGVNQGYWVYLVECVEDAQDIPAQ